jgi:hypothetical protein
MEIPSKSERVEFWKSAYARSSFIQARLYCHRFLDTTRSGLEVEDSALSCAAIVTYMRPFKQRKVVRLDAAVVPTEFQKLHSRLEEYRDKVVAHRDLDGPKTPWGIVSELTLAFDGKGFDLLTFNAIMDRETAGELSALCSVLVDVMDSRLNEFVRRFVPNRPPGNFGVSLDEIPPDWLVRQSPASS